MLQINRLAGSWSASMLRYNAKAEGRTGYVLWRALVDTVSSTTCFVPIIDSHIIDHQLL